MTAAQDLLIPVHRFTAGGGSLHLAGIVTLASATEADVLPLAQLALDLTAAGLRPMVALDDVPGATVRIRRDPSIRGPEAYRLTVSPAGVEILASADAGAYYAVQTLRDLLAQRRLPRVPLAEQRVPLAEQRVPLAACPPVCCSDSTGGQAASGTPGWKGLGPLPCCSITDRPDFARRGVYLDCSRGKRPRLETLIGLVEQLARWKINELELYVENVFTWRKHPDIGRGYSPFTPAELLALQDVCRRHHVRLVGSLASLGHMEKILSLPRYQSLGELPGYRDFPGGTMLSPVDPGSIRLVRDLYEEFVPLFEAPDFNACLDEPWELGQGRSRRRAERVGAGRVYLEFLKKVHGLCCRHGKRMNAWADIVLDFPEIIADLPQDIVMLNWDYNPAGKRIRRTREITDAGLAVVVCPGTNSWQTHGCRLQMGMKNIARFAREGLARGAEGLLNTDWGDYGHRNPLAVSLHNLAYGAAHSWHTRGTRDAGFTERFCRAAFGCDIAASVRVLGRAQEALGLPYINHTPLYNVFLGPLAGWATSDDWQVKPLDQVKASSLADHRADLARLRWPAPADAPTPLTEIALEEYALATRLDRLACLRAAAVKDVRAGRSVRPSALRQLVRETEDVLEELPRVWLLANEPSRLRDQTSGLRQAMREYKRMLKK